MMKCCSGTLLPCGEKTISFSVINKKSKLKRMARLFIVALIKKKCSGQGDFKLGAWLPVSLLLRGAGRSWLLLCTVILC
jgi:hypothetical protein